MLDDQSGVMQSQVLRKLMRIYAYHGFRHDDKSISVDYDSTMEHYMLIGVEILRFPIGNVPSYRTRSSALNPPQWVVKVLECLQSQTRLFPCLFYSSDVCSSGPGTSCTNFGQILFEIEINDKNFKSEYLHNYKS